MLYDKKDSRALGMLFAMGDAGVEGQICVYQPMHHILEEISSDVGEYIFKS